MLSAPRAAAAAPRHRIRERGRRGGARLGLAPLSRALERRTDVRHLLHAAADRGEVGVGFNTAGRGKIDRARLVPIDAVRPNDVVEGPPQPLCATARRSGNRPRSSVAPRPPSPRSILQLHRRRVVPSSCGRDGIEADPVARAGAAAGAANAREPSLENHAARAIPRPQRKRKAMTPIAHPDGSRRNPKARRERRSAPLRSSRAREGALKINAEWSRWRLCFSYSRPLPMRCCCGSNTGCTAGPDGLGRAWEPDWEEERPSILRRQR